MAKLNVTVWNEYIHEKDEKISKIYPEGIHGAIAQMLGAYNEYNIRTATLEEPEYGLTDEVLENTDVLIWWGHLAHAKVSDEIALKVKNRVLEGMGFVVLHSGHLSKPFVMLMGTACRSKWRFVKEYAGTGVLGDLGVHLIDMAELLTGKIQSVSGVADIIVKERMYLDRDEYGVVETDDYCSFISKIEGGINAGFMITRCAIGHGNTIKYDIYGTKGVISFDLNNPDVLGICTADGEFKEKKVQTVSVPEEFNITQEQMFIDLLHGKPCELLPTVADGYRYQKILDDLLLSSVEKRWVDID